VHATRPLGSLSDEEADALNRALELILQGRGGIAASRPHRNGGAPWPSGSPS
jgi:hypothetical protein